MRGIDLNTPITYKNASLRFFGEKEHHVTRCCAEDVLLLVFEGILRFEEGNKKREVHAGQYYIQEKNTPQTGKIASDSPKYLYVHFLADWIESKDGIVLPRQGSFDIATVKPISEKLSRLFHNRATMIEQTAKFFEILAKLYQNNAKFSLADKIANFISKNYLNDLTLETISEEFNFSRNHIINLLKKEYAMTPFEYINHLKVRQAEQLLEVTSKPVEDICYECGFNNYSHFYRLFHRVHQISPTEYRRQKRLWPSEKIIGGYSNADSWDIFVEAAWLNCIRTGPLPTVQKGDVLRFEVDMSLSAQEGVEIKDTWKIARLNMRLYDFTDASDARGEEALYYGDTYKQLKEKVHPIYGYTYRTLTSTFDTSILSGEYMYALNNANGLKAVAIDSQVSQASGNKVTRQVYRAAIINESTGETLYEITGQNLFDKLASDFSATAIEKNILPSSGDSERIIEQ